MTEQQFVYWLQGFVELNPNAMLTLTQWQIVKDHLAQVFKKETPQRFFHDTPTPVTTLPYIPPRFGTQEFNFPPGTVIC